MMIEEFGEQLTRLWHDLRPATRSLVERALTVQTNNAIAARRAARVKSNTNAVAPTIVKPYDAQGEVELRRLLAALDERLVERRDERLKDELAAITNERVLDVELDVKQIVNLRRFAETCAGLLVAQAQSAEAFAQLLERALRVADFARVDVIADRMTVQLSVSELCELARHANPAVRAVAFEALTQMPISRLIELIADPVDALLVREALECQAIEYNNEEARWVVEALDDNDVEFMSLNLDDEV